MNITNKMIENYKTHLIEEEKAIATRKKYVRDVLSFALWLGGREITKTAVMSYKEELLAKYAPKSVNSMLSSLNNFFSFNELHNCKVKTLKLQKSLFSEKEKELTKSEYERLLKVAKDRKNERIYLIMQTICATGIRVSELSYITCDAVKIGQAQVKLKGKMRIVFLNKNLCALLKKYAKRQGITAGSIFVTKFGKPLDRHAIWKSMKNLCSAAGVAKEKAFPHNLRHLFARTYYSMQKDIVRLADILGHSSINTTRIYTIESGETHRKQLEKLGLVHMRM